jgi:hypothetical protein
MKLSKKIIGCWLIIACAGFANCYGQRSNKTDWFKKSSYGILVHYLYNLQNSRQPWNLGKQTTWDSCVNDFDAEKFANDVAETGAGYVIFTIQQNNQFFSSPNSTFEKITGYKRGTATPKRDLINDIYKALNAKKIKLMLYVTGNGPFADPRSLSALTNNSYTIKKDKNHGDVLVIDTVFLKSWSAVLRDISLRYKSKIKGWWVDGAYPFIGYNDAYLKVLSSALTAGNKDAIVAFNQAPQNAVSYYSKVDDYTAGEMYHINTLPQRRFINNVQWHALTFLGKEWAQPGTRFTRKEVESYIRNVNLKEGVVTFDVCLYRNGSIDIEQKKLFKEVKNNLKYK